MDPDELNIDLTRPGIPYTAVVLGPTIAKVNGRYCCLLGEEANTAVTGYGDTPEQAIQSWDQQLEQRISNAGIDDNLAMGWKKQLGQLANTSPAADGTEGEKQQGDQAHELPAEKNTTNDSNANGAEYR